MSTTTLSLRILVPMAVAACCAYGLALGGSCYSGPTVKATNTPAQATSATAVPAGSADIDFDSAIPDDRAEAERPEGPGIVKGDGDPPVASASPRPPPPPAKPPADSPAPEKGTVGSRSGPCGRCPPGDLACIMSCSSRANAGSSGAEFDRGAAKAAIQNAGVSAKQCKEPGGPTGKGRVKITYANSGRPVTVTVDGPPFAGTSVGGCVATRYRAATVPPFEGSPVTVVASFTIE